MIDILIHLVVLLLIFGVVWWAVNAILPLIQMPGSIPQIVRVLIIVIFAIALIYALLPLLHVGLGSRWC